MTRKTMMTKFSVLFATMILAISGRAAGPKVQVLHSFTGGTDGLQPYAGLVADASGNLYGTAPNGGSTTACSNQGCGVVFKLSAPKSQGGAWKESILYRFTGGADGSHPFAGLVFDSQGNLYGTTENGGDFDGLCVVGQTDIGCGVVFQLSPNSDGTWAETTPHAFSGQNSDGANPVADLIFDSFGNLYGTTEVGGGCQSNCGLLQGAGIVFELTPNGTQNWAETIIYQFMAGNDGAYPVTGLTFDQLGNLYGTAIGGGSNGYGSVYELMPPVAQGAQWSESTLYSFSSPAGTPRGGVIFDKEGNLYGTTSLPTGTAFQLSPAGDGAWTESTLYAFGIRTNMPYAGLVSDSSGNLYGTTSGRYCGGVFRLQNAGGKWNEAESDFFTGQNGPCSPLAGLIIGKWGAGYGTTVGGGKCSVHGGCGTVFGILP